MPVRRIELLRGGWGLGLLLFPTAILALDDAGTDRRGVLVTRILGARQLCQAILSGANPSPEVLAMGAWVDTAHAATALGLATLDHSPRLALLRPLAGPPAGGDPGRATRLSPGAGLRSACAT